MRFFRLVPVLFAVACAGCGGDPMNRQPVSGQVRFGGKDVKFGSVRFEPADGQKTAASADVRDGKFALSRAAGLSPGRYKVWVQAFDRVPDPVPGAAPGSEGPPPRDILPKKYADSPATETTVAEVPDDKPNELVIDLK